MFSGRRLIRMGKRFFQRSNRDFRFLKENSNYSSGDNLKRSSGFGVSSAVTRLRLRLAARRDLQLAAQVFERSSILCHASNEIMSGRVDLFLPPRRWNCFRLTALWMKSACKLLIGRPSLAIGSNVSRSVFAYHHG